jgi:hypothetical protein
MENNMEVLRKLKTKMPHDQARPLLGIYSKEWKSCYNKGTYTPTFIAALFRTAKLWKQLRCSLLINGLRKCGIYKNEYRIFKLVETTIRKELREKKEK